MLVLRRDARDSAHIRFVLVVPLLRTVLDRRLDGVLLLADGSPCLLLLLRHAVLGAHGVFRGGVDLLGDLSGFAPTSSWGHQAAAGNMDVAAVLEILVHGVDLHIVGIVSVGPSVAISLLLSRTLGTAKIRSGSLLLLSRFAPVVTDVGIRIVLGGIQRFLNRYSIVLDQDGILGGAHAVLLGSCGDGVVEVIRFLQRVGSRRDLDVVRVLRCGLHHPSVNSLGRGHRAGFGSAICDDEGARASGQMRVILRQIVAGLGAGGVVVSYFIRVRLVIHMNQVNRLLLQVVRHRLVGRHHVARRDVLVDQELVVRGDDVHVVVFDPLLVVIRRHHEGVAVRKDEFLHLFLAHHLHLLLVGMRDFPEALLLSLVLLEIGLRIASFAVIGPTHRPLLLDTSGGSRIRLDAPVFEESCLVVVYGVVIVWVEHASPISRVIGPVLLLSIVLRSHGLLEVDLLQGVVDVIQVLLLKLRVQLGSVRGCRLRALDLARVGPVAERLSVGYSRNILRSWGDSLAILDLLLGLLLVQINIVLVDEKQGLLTLLFRLLLRRVRGRNHLADAQLLLVLDLLDGLDVHVAILLVLGVLGPARR